MNSLVIKWKPQMTVHFYMHSCRQNVLGFLNDVHNASVVECVSYDYNNFVADCVISPHAFLG